MHRPPCVRLLPACFPRSCPPACHFEKRVHRSPAPRRSYSCHSGRSRRPMIGHESLLETSRCTLIMRVKKLIGLKTLQRYKKQLFYGCYFVTNCNSVASSTALY